MAYGRISVVLGVAQGLGPILDFCRSQQQKVRNQTIPDINGGNGQKAVGLASRSGVSSFNGGAPAPVPKNRLSDEEIFALVTQLAALDKQLRRDEIEVHWSLMGGSPFIEIPLLTKIFEFAGESVTMVSIEDLQSLDLDAIVYAPLDVQQPKQVEQLMRLSMMAPRVRHVAFAQVPRWNHAQLMALREIWHWIDPKQSGKIPAFCDDVIRVNGGLTRKDIAKVNFSQMPAMPEVTQDPVIITRSPRMKEVLYLVDAVADTDSTILITGGSGTGKELIAQRIHARSHRHVQQMNAVNCGAIPAELLESELFGHVKGAFTGAVRDREGRFEAAEKGSLFLDEIGEMGPNLQVKLLRVLQTRRFEPVGSTKSKVADVRIIAATNRDLEEEVKMGRFREDLFYRLNVIPVHVPDLKERKEDIQLLVEFFIKKFNGEKTRRVTGVTRAALRALVAYDWPGNIRELENLMERMVILKSSGMIDVLDFPEKYRRVSLSEIEYEDLMNSSRLSSTGAPNTAPSQSMSANSYQHEEELGEGLLMKDNGIFIKGHIQQSSPSQPEGHSIERKSEVSEMRDIEGGMAIEQAIQLMADKLIFPQEGLDFNSIVDQFENILILQALERTGWNRNRAAGLLRLNRTTLVEKLKKKQLMPPMRFEENFMGGNA